MAAASGGGGGGGGESGGEGPASEGMRKLLKRSMSSGDSKRRGDTALHQAVRDDDLDDVRDALAAELCDIDGRSDNGWTALKMAVRRGSEVRRKAAGTS